MSDSEISATELFGIVFANWKIVCFTPFLCTVAAGIFLLFINNQYTSGVLLAPSKNTNASVSDIGGLGGVAALAGINIASDTNNVSLAIAILKSKQFVGDFIKKYKLDDELLAVSSWDRSTNELIYRKSYYDQASEKWKKNPSGKGREPTPHDLYDAFMDRMNVIYDKSTGFVTIQITYVSPEIAKDWVEKLLFEINERLRKRDVEEAEIAIDYLSEQIQSTSLSEMRSVFYGLVEEHTKTILLARSKVGYVFEVIDPPYIPYEKSYPHRALICLLVLFFTLVSMLVFVITKEVVFESKEI